jgi:hypothetical protein
MRKFSNFIHALIELAFTLLLFDRLNNSEDSDDDETSFSEERKKKDLILVRY